MAGSSTRSIVPVVAKLLKPKAKLSCNQDLIEAVAIAL